MALIASSIPGRIRIRHKAFAHAGRSRQACEAFLALDGISSVEANPAAASLTVHYDASQIPVDAMEASIDSIVDAELKARHGERAREAAVNRYAKYGMLLSLAASLALAAGGARRAHIWSGSLFVACLGLHLYFHRTRITA